MSVWRLHLGNNPETGGSLEMFHNQFCFYASIVFKEKKTSVTLICVTVGMAVLWGQKDVALVTEAASIFHHNDLRIFPFCQPDELNSVRVSGKPHTFFFLRYTKWLEKDVEHFSHFVVHFLEKRSFICFFWRGFCEAELDFQDWFQNHEWWVLDSATYNQRTTATNQQQFPESFSQAWGPKLAWQRIWWQQQDICFDAIDAGQQTHHKLCQGGGWEYGVKRKKTGVNSPVLKYIEIYINIYVYVYIASLALARFDSHVDYIMISLQDSGRLNNSEQKCDVQSVFWNLWVVAGPWQIWRVSFRGADTSGCCVGELHRSKILGKECTRPAKKHASKACNIMNIIQHFVKKYTLVN